MPLGGGACTPVRSQNLLLTSVQVRVRLIGAQEHGLTRLQEHVVEEVDGEAANVSGILRVEAEQQLAVAA